MIKQKPTNIPAQPGVYFFLDAKGKRLYIGKAAVLRNRLGSYFQKVPRDLRIQRMLETATRVEWQETGSEIEALILESQFIKKYKPPYNISLRDDKNYVYVAFTQEELPKVLVTHQPKSSTAVKLYSYIASAIGPFTSSAELRAALKTLRKLFPYCTCKQKHNRPCLNAHIGKCLGFCCLKAPSYELQVMSYKKNIKILKDILSGKRQAFMKQFPNVFANTRVIREIAGREQALIDLQKTFQLPALPHRIEGYDISNIQGRHATGSMVVFENGTPNKSEYRKFKIKAPASPDDTRMLKEMLERRFHHPEWSMPDILLIDGGKGQINTAITTVGPLIPILSIAKGKQEVFSTTLPQPLAISHLPSAVRNLILHVDAEAHRFAISFYRTLHRQTVSGTIK